MVRLDVAGRRIDLLIDEVEFERRRAALAATLAKPLPSRGYARLFQQTVTQADQGCDFDFMLRPPGASE
jgi:dihydroxy-acid dehydratase